MTDHKPARPVPGLYQHFRGGEYQVVDVVRDRTNCDPARVTGCWMVLYYKVDHVNNMIVRNLREFLETVHPDGKPASVEHTLHHPSCALCQPRFKLVERA